MWNRCGNVWLVHGRWLLRVAGAVASDADGGHHRVVDVVVVVECHWLLGLAGGDSQTALAAMVFAATVTAVCACCAVVLLSFVGSAGRRPLPASFRFDATVMNAVRSWARPQWMPRWPRYTLPDSRI